MPIRRLSFALFAILSAAWPAGYSRPCLAAKPEREQEFRDKVTPLLKKYCYDCHGDKTTEGDLSLQGYKSAQSVLEGRKIWFKVIHRVTSNEMPPKDAKEQPTKEERKFLGEWAEAVVNEIDCTGSPNPGRVTIRRLNRYEYKNTIRDLFGVDYKPAADFPADDVGYGFDNIGDVLSLPPILLEKYLAAAEEITGQAIVTKPPPFGIAKKVDGREFDGAGGRHNDTERIITSNGEAATQFKIPEDGEYEIKVVAYGDQAGPEKVKMAIRLDGKDEKTVDVLATEDKPATYEHKLRLKSGRHKIGLAFVNDYYMPDDPDRNNRDRNLIVVRLDIKGPLDARPPEPPESHKRIFFVSQSKDLTRREAARKILERQASRAYRRPATDAELDRLMKIFNLVDERKENFETCIQVALQAILVSPHFLFKVELNTPPDKPEELDRYLTDYELASSLSYFLWSSMPDDELFRAAWQGELRKGNNLEQQARRMLADPKANALVENFAVQWLQLRNLDTIAPDKGKFPTFDDKLRRAMRLETEHFFAAILHEDRSILDLLGADFTFLNEQLAKHYGVEGVQGDDFRKVSVAGTPRGGVLTQASVLTVTSNPTRTSPVKRGKFVLDNLLGTPPPPPAPDVPQLKEGELTGTLRQQMEQHRANPACATCHKQMDTLGFALENFDAIGGWRTMDGKFPIDPAGELPDGSKIGGPQDIKTILVTKRKTEFIRCLAEKVLTYALGRGLEYYDKCTIDKIAAALEKNDYRFSTLFVETVKSDPFLKRRVAKP